jgi:hypothetical protein
MDRNDYLKKVNSIFEKWNFERNYSEAFVRDGILDFECFRNQRPKILFLLFETYNNYRQIGDSYDKSGEVNIHDGTGNFFWWNICRWKHSIYQIYNNKNIRPTFPENNTFPELIRDIAIVDIKKKDDNKSTTYRPEIINYAKNDREYLKEEIELINPNIIFCGSTFEYLKIIFNSGNIVPLTKQKKNCYKFNNSLIIDFYHPSIRRKHKPYDELCDLLINYRVFDSFKWE